MRTPKAEISNALSILFEAGDVVEVRILNTRNGTVSGYFNDMDKLAHDAMEWNAQASGIYVTLNPVNPDLLARSTNRLKKYARHATSDTDIVKRRWFPLDFDPVRPSGISATEKEHNAALARAKEVCDWLGALGWPNPIFADSGNGAHLPYLIDLPNSPEITNLIKRCLAALAFHFSDELVTLDLTTYNAARIWKLYGTTVCKGDNTIDRPHRMACVLAVPGGLEVVSRNLLEQLAAILPKEQTRITNDKREQEFDLERWITKHELSVARMGPWNGGRKFVLKYCPWNVEHTNGSAYIVEFSNGAIAAGCHHNGCAGKEWPDLRDKLDPRWRERKQNSNHDRASETRNPEQKDENNPWAFAKDAPSLLSEEEKEFKGLAKDILAPGAVTLIASPRGVGKTQFSHALAVALATGGMFRNERIQPVPVLLLDRDNPKAIVKKRLRSWGAGQATDLCVLTRESAPDLKDKRAWETFPLTDYDVLIIDSVGSSTEGITEKEGKETTQVLATILDLARKGLAILLLTNCTKDALNLKGRGEWADRVDILYEVRDATGFTPSGKKSWWQELPEAGESAWAERATRRKGRIDYRLAFIPSKFRPGPEPEPFCLEIRVPDNESWTLCDVTSELLQAGEEAMAQAKKKEEERLENAAGSLADIIRERATDEKLIFKTEAENLLHGQGLTREQARSLIDCKDGILWRIENVPGKGNPKGLFPFSHGPKNDSAAEMGSAAKRAVAQDSKGGISADRAQSGPQKCSIPKPASGLHARGSVFSPPDERADWEDEP